MVGAGHGLRDIQEFTLHQFTIHLAAVDREDADRRRRFLVDLSATMGGAFGGGDFLKKHLELLAQAVNEEHLNGRPKRS